MTTREASVNLTELKAKQQSVWGSGDYALIGARLQIVGEQLADACVPAAGSRILDVAAGNGNATLAFARRFCEVTSTDYVPALLERGKSRAEADGLEVTYQTEDAEALSFADGTFDGVVSTFGVMFTPDQAAAAREMQRVCRSGGTIGMANWTPDSFVGGMFRVASEHAPPPAGAPKPGVWGTEPWIRDQFGNAARDIAIEKKAYIFYQRTPQAFIDYFRAFYGPTRRAFERLDEQGQAALNDDMLVLIDAHNLATDGTMRVPGEYLQVVITKA